jgi:tRNA/rRNA methyltransferase
MMKGASDTGNAGNTRDQSGAGEVSPVGGDISAKGPAIILIGPQLPENIGFAARAMANFGLSELRLVRPRERWPNEKARAAAAGANHVIDTVTVHDDLKTALADLNYVIATTARPRGMTKPVLAPEAASQELAKRTASGERTGILFGPERSGLDNEAISLADAILTAPVEPGFASLSLPQAVLLVSYEWLKATSGAPTLGRATAFDGPAAEGSDQSGSLPASRAELFALFDHIESELDRAGFLRPPEKRATMVRAIRNMFHRMRMTEQDVRTWRGIIAMLAGTRKTRETDGS